MKFSARTKARLGNARTELAVGQEQLRLDNCPQGALMARDDSATANLCTLINFLPDTNLNRVPG